MATRSELRDRLQYRLGNRTDMGNTRLDAWLDDGLLDLATQRIEIRSLESVGTPVTSVVDTAGYVRNTAAFTLLYLEDTTNNRVLTRIPGGFNEYLLAKQSETSRPEPTRFTEYGNRFYVQPAPSVATIIWQPYEYLRPTWASGEDGEPSIETEWHYAIGLVAAEHAFRDLGDDIRAAQVAQEFADWLGRRDTAVRRTRRHTRPQRGVQPAITRRNRVTGV
jgi:hypothetical protein